MGHSSSLIGDSSLVGSTSGVSRRSSSSAGVVDDVDISAGRLIGTDLAFFRPQRPWLLING